MGRPTSVPWARRGLLHVGNRSVRAEVTSIRHSAGTTAVEHRVGRTYRWSLVVGRRLLPLVSGTPVDLRVSSTGSRVVWKEEPSDDQRRLSVWDVGTRTVVATHTEMVDVFCCTGGGDLTLHGQNAQGAVIYSVRGDAYVWWPDHALERVTGVPPAPFVAQVWPGGFMYQGRGPWPEIPGVFGTVGRDGRFREVGRTPTDQSGLWSSYGRYFAYEADASGSAGAKNRDRVWVQDAVTGTHRELALPSGPGWSIVAWESPTEVLLAAGGEPALGGPPGVHALARCDAYTLACERPRGAPRGLLTLPEW